MATIKIACKGAEEVSIDDLEEFQGDLKAITTDNLEKLKTRIKKSFDVPFHIWKHKETNYILDGHQRLKAIRELQKEGWKLPKFPIDYIYAENEDEAREKLLEIIAQYGEINEDELSDWLADCDEELLNSLRFVEGEIDIINKETISKIKTEQIKPYEMVHILISIPVNSISGAIEKIQEITKIEGVEIEQSNN